MAMTPREKLVEYLKRNLRKGYTLESLKWALVKQGYSRSAVELAIQKVQEEMSEKAPVIKEKPVISYHLVDDNFNEIPVKLKKPFWKRILEIFK